MRKFDMNISGDWAYGILADDFAQAKYIVKQTLGGEVLDHREYILINEEWVEVMV